MNRKSYTKATPLEMEAAWDFWQKSVEAAEESNAIGYSLPQEPEAEAIVVVADNKGIAVMRYGDIANAYTWLESGRIFQPTPEGMNGARIRIIPPQFEEK